MFGGVTVECGCCVLVGSYRTVSGRGLARCKGVRGVVRVVRVRTGGC